MNHFLGGNSAMIRLGSWLVRDMKDHERFPRDFEIGWTYLPRFDESIPDNRVIMSVSSMGIPAASRNQAAAFEFIRFYIMENAHVIAATGNIPCYLGAWDDDLMHVFIEGSGLDIEYAKRIFNPNITFASHRPGFPPEFNPTGPLYTRIMSEEVELFFIGEQDIDTTMANVVERVNQMIAEEESR
jgi:multiple sugar transport system substrate-binding protein